MSTRVVGKILYIKFQNTLMDGSFLYSDVQVFSDWFFSPVYFYIFIFKYSFMKKIIKLCHCNIFCKDTLYSINLINLILSFAFYNRYKILKRKLYFRKPTNCHFKFSNKFKSFIFVYFTEIFKNDQQN